MKDFCLYYSNLTDTYISWDLTIEDVTYPPEIQHLKDFKSAGKFRFYLETSGKLWVHEQHRLVLISGLYSSISDVDIKTGIIYAIDANDNTLVKISGITINRLDLKVKKLISKQFTVFAIGDDCYHSIANEKLETFQVEGEIKDINQGYILFENGSVKKRNGRKRPVLSNITSMAYSPTGEYFFLDGNHQIHTVDANKFNLPINNHPILLHDSYHSENILIVTNTLEIYSYSDITGLRKINSTKLFIL